MTGQRLKIGAHAESLGLPLRRALDEIERMGAAGVQVDAVGDLSPRELSQTGRRELLHLLRSHNLELAALTCPLRQGLDVAEGQQARIEHVKKVLSLSYELGSRSVLIQAGRIPEDPNSGRAGLLREALLALGHHADRTGAILALETGLNPGKAVSEFLARLDTGGLGVSFNPASFLMNGMDPYDNARALQGRIVYAKGQDARQAGPHRVAQEVPLGHGDVDWLQMLGVLEEVEYRDWLTIERETGDNRLQDVARGVALLRRFLGGIS